MVDIYIISDTHFGHANIIRYCNRPFADAQEMDEKMIAAWNDVVRPQDHVYHLGDFAVSEERLVHCAERLNGHKRLILGNHDNHAPMATYARMFEKILAWRLFKPVILTHMPLHQGSFGKADVNVHGHIHERPSPAGPYVNACVEWRDYKPVHLDEFIKLAKAVI